MKRTTAWALIALFVLSFALRIFIAFDSPYYDNKAYYNIRQIESIQETGLPLYDDPLAYGGRTTFFPPLFQYVMSGIDYFFPLKFSLKFFPNLFASTVVFMVYFIAWELTKDEKSSLFASFAGSTVPVFFAETTNAVSDMSLAIPLLLLSLYLFMVSGKGTKYVVAFIVSLILLMLTSPLVMLAIIIMLLYLVLIRVERLRIMKSELELILFSSFLVAWLYFLTYKRPLMLHGVSVLSLNLPSSVLDQIFGQFTVVEALVMIGIVPLIAGVYITYKHIFIERKKPFYLVISAIIASSILLWVRLIPLKTGLIVLGLSFSIIFADYFKKLMEYIDRSRVSRLRPLFIIALFLLILVTSLGPAYYVTAVSNADVVPEEDVAALIWLKNNAAQGSVIASSLPESDLVAYSTGKKVMADNQFIGVEDAEEVTDALRELYRTPWKTDALRITDKYSIDYIIITETARDYYGIENIKYADRQCFKTIYNGYEKVKIYRVGCSLGGQG